MYIDSDQLFDEIMDITNEIYKKTNGVVIFEEYISLPFYGNIILRFNLNKDEYTLNELDKYERIMNAIVQDQFLVDFMGSVYKKVGLNIQTLNQILPKCYEKYRTEEILKSYHQKKLIEDAQYLLELCGLSKDLDVWEIQNEDEIQLFILSDTYKTLGSFDKGDKIINVYEINKMNCEGLMKALVYSKNNNISLVRALLEV